MAIWTIQAQRQLRHSLARLLCDHNLDNPEGQGNCLQPIQDKMERLDQILARTFPDARHIVVRDHLVGFRRKEETYVLLVEVDGPDRGGPYVVKIGRPQKLSAELHGWNCCRPAGLKHDLVLLPLEEGCRLPAEGPAEWISLVYGDAQQFIGVERTLALEEALLGAVEYGQPTVGSIGFVLVQLLERLGHLLYATSFVENAGAAGYVFRMPKVVQGMGLWNQDPFHQSVRTDTNVLVNHGVSRFIDPVDYFEHWILPFFSWEERLADGTTNVHRAEEVFAPPQLPPAVPAPPVEPQPQPHDLVPYILRGCAHGDLHGRNILVGLVGNQAMWPTVFDYEDMGPGTYVGWDFVKLEMEHKIRAFSRIMPRDDLPFLESVRDFEIALNEQTEKHHLDGSWPVVQEQDEPVDRLRALLLELRRMAALHLGKHRGRAKQWLEEYYFLLAAYGVNSATYRNLDRRELVAAYISAGVATARLSWPRRREPWERTHLGI
jgi:hypothetical protein